MRASSTTIRLLVAALSVAIVVCGAYGVAAYTRHLRNLPAPVAQAASNTGAADAGSVELSQQTADLARIKTSEAVASQRPRKLELRGSLATDPNRLAHVHARFPGQIVELATVDGGTGEPEKSAYRKPLGYMDHVSKGQDLAVLWSKDLGEKKSELVDALAHWRIDKQTLRSLEELGRLGAGTEASWRAAKLQVELDENAARRAELTLRSWMLTDSEIDAVRAEAERLGERAEAKTGNDKDWARLNVAAPMDGTIMEKNVTIGESVDTNVNLFVIADLTVLNVWLHAYEEDLPYLPKLPFAVDIRLPSSPELGSLPATIDRIGEIIDPSEHMALLIGSVENTNRGLRVGQFATASVTVPPEPHVVEIPAKALIDDNDESFVFVQSDPARLRYTRRRVAVSRRYFDAVQVRNDLTDAERQQGLRTLHPGERVVSSGISQLQEILENRSPTEQKQP